MAYKRRASVSQMQKYAACPRAWYWRYIRKVKDEKSVHLARGVHLHSVIEELSNTGPRAGKYSRKNYKTRIPELAFEIFEESYIAPGNYFGRPAPSVYEDFLEVFDNDEDAVECAKADSRLMLQNYVDKFLVNLEMTFLKNGDFSKAVKAVRPSFTEWEIDMDQLTGYIDCIFEVHGKVMLSDLKTSKLPSGRAIDSDFYVPTGFTGINPEYEFQLKVYLYAYYKLTGVKASYLALQYLAYGYETVMPTDYIDIDKLVEEMDKLISTFMEITESQDIADYPMNYANDVSNLPHLHVDNTFCSCHQGNMKGRGFCAYDKFCNEELGEAEDEPEFITIKFNGTFETATLPFWMAKTKGIKDLEITVDIEKETEKALLVTFDGDSAWLPKSQLNY